MIHSSVESQSVLVLLDRQIQPCRLSSVCRPGFVSQLLLLNHFNEVLVNVRVEICFMGMYLWQSIQIPASEFVSYNYILSRR